MAHQRRERHHHGSHAGSGGGAASAGKGGAGAKTTAGLPGRVATSDIPGHWHSVCGTLLMDTANPFCPLQPALFEWTVYAFLLDTKVGAVGADAVEQRLQRPGREAYLKLFHDAQAHVERDRPHLEKLERAIADLVRGGDVQNASTRIIAQHAVLSRHGKRAIVQKPALAIEPLQEYVDGPSYRHGALAGGPAGGNARKAACEDLVEGLRHGAPKLVVLPSAAPAADGAAPAEAHLTEEAARLREEIRARLAGASNRKLTTDALKSLELRILAASAPAREIVLGDVEIRELLVQSIDPTQGHVLLEGLDAVEALYQQCRSTMPRFEYAGRRFDMPAKADNKAIKLLRAWFLSHPAPMRLRALRHPGLERDVYAHLPADQRREVTRLATTGTADGSAHDELLDAIEARDGARVIHALRALAAADADALAKLQNDAAFVAAIGKLDRPVAVGRQTLVPLQVCRELWGASEPEEPAQGIGSPLTAEERLLLGRTLFDPFVEEVHGIMEGRARKRDNDPFDYSSAGLSGAWGLPDYAQRGKAMREVLVRFEHAAAMPQMAMWLRREGLAAGPELERRLEQRHHVSLRDWSTKLSARDRGDVDRVIDVGPSAATRVVDGTVSNGDAAVAAGKVPLSQALHQVMVLGRTMSEWTGDESRALAEAVAARNEARTLAVWGRYVGAAGAAMPQVFVLTGVTTTPAELMANAFRVHAGDLRSRVNAAFTGEALDRVRAALHLAAEVTADAAPEPPVNERVRPWFTDAEAKARAAKMWRLLHDGGRVDVVDVHLLADLSRGELHMVDAAFRELSGGIDFTVYLREAMRVREEQSESRAALQKTIGYRLDEQMVKVGGESLVIHGSDTELERALALAEGRGLDPAMLLRLAAGNKSGEQVQRVINELDASQRAKILGDGGLLDFMRAHLGQRDWERAMKSLSGAPPAVVPAVGAAESPAEDDDGGWATLMAARSDKAVLRALSELDFKAAQRLQADLPTQMAIMQRLGEKHRAEAAAILSHASGGTGGVTDPAEYDARQAVHRLRIALGQSWKAVLTQAVAIYKLPIERDPRMHIWTAVNDAVRAYAARQRVPGGLTDDAITEQQIVKVISDAVLGQADPSDALVAASIETVEERHARNERLSEELGRPGMFRPVAYPGLDQGVKESSTADEGELAAALRAASPQHVIAHWSSVLQWSVDGQEPMIDRYQRVKAASSEEARRNAIESFLAYSIGLSAEFESLLLPHMGNDRRASRVEAGPRVDRRDNKRYNALAQIIRTRIADLPPSALVAAMGIKDDDLWLVMDPSDPKHASANFRANALGRALDEEHVDRRGNGTHNLAYANALGQAYDVSEAREKQERARAQIDHGAIADEDARKLAVLRGYVGHDRDAHKHALESEAAWKSLLVGTIATVLVSVVTAGLGTGLVPTLLLTAVTAGAGSAASARIKREILDVDFDDQDAVEQIRQDVYKAVVNAAASHLAKQLLSLKSVKDKIGALKTLLADQPEWLTRMLGKAGENLVSEVVTVGFETGAAAISGDDIGDILSHAPSRLLRATAMGAVSGAMGGEHGEGAKGWNPLATGKQIFDPKSVGLGTLFAVLWGDQPLTLRGVAQAAAGEVQGNAINAHGEHSGGDEDDGATKPPAPEEKHASNAKELGKNGPGEPHPGVAHPTTAAAHPRASSGDPAIDRAHANLDRKGTWLANQVRVDGLEYHAGAFKFRVGDETHVIIVRPAQLEHAQTDVHVGERLHVITVDADNRQAIFERLVIAKLHEVARGVLQEHHGARKPGQLVVSGDDLRTIEYAAKVKGLPGMLDLVIHGGVDHGYVFKDGKRHALDAKVLANLIKASGKEHAMIRLLSCGTGAHPQAVAQHLANQLGVVVLAPNDTVFITESGELVVGPSSDKNTGSFEAFAPEKSSRREGAESGETVDAAVPNENGDVSLGGDRRGEARTKPRSRGDDDVQHDYYLPRPAAEESMEKWAEMRESAGERATEKARSLKELATMLEEADVDRLTGEKKEANRELQRLRELHAGDAEAQRLIRRLVKEREALTKARYTRDRAAEAIGSRMSIEFMNDVLPGFERVFPPGRGVPPPGRPGELDFVYARGKGANLEVVVIEAKGGGAEAGERKSSDGKSYEEQGSPAYLHSIASKMLDEAKAKPGKPKRLERVLEKIVKGGEGVRYFKVSAPVGPDGVHGRIEEQKLGR